MQVYKLHRLIRLDDGWEGKVESTETNLHPFSGNIITISYL